MSDTPAVHLYPHFDGARGGAQLHQVQESHLALKGALPITNKKQTNKNTVLCVLHIDPRYHVLLSTMSGQT